MAKQQGLEKRMKEMMEELKVCTVSVAITKSCSHPLLTHTFFCSDVF